MAVMRIYLIVAFVRSFGILFGFLLDPVESPSVSTSQNGRRHSKVTYFCLVLNGLFPCQS